MVVYVKLEQNEIEFLKEAVQDLRSQATQVQLKAIDVNRLRNQKKRESMGINNEIKNIHEEILQIRLMLPHIGEKMKEKRSPAKMIKEKPIRGDYESELKELKKRIAGLK